MKTVSEHFVEDTNLSPPDEAGEGVVKVQECVEPILAIPNNCCNMDAPFLKENPDLLPTDLTHQSHAYCEKIFRHLNDCYFCFEIYSDEMRRYLRLME